MQPLPQSLGAEQGLLGAIIIENTIYDELEISEEDFYEHSHKIIFRIFKTLRENGKPIDLMLMRDFIEAKNIQEETRGISYLCELTEACTHTSNWKGYHDSIKETSNRRKIILEGRKIESLGFGEDISDIYKRISDLKISVDTKRKRGNSIENLVELYANFRERFNSQGGLGYEGPYKKLDQYIGGIIPGKVYTIVAYSGVGKSNFSYSYVVDALKKGKKVIFFSLEVQSDILFTSILKAYYHKTQKQVMSENFYFELGDFESLTIYDDVYELQEIKAITKASKPDIVFIDFIQNVRTKGNTEYDKMTQIAQEIQQTAIETDITFFNISQANNESRFRDSDRIQPKGSGAIFASSDIILALHRDGGNLKLNLVKNKYGPSDRNFLIIPNFKTLQFTLDKEIDEKYEEQVDYFQ